MQNLALVRVHDVECDAGRALRQCWRVSDQERGAWNQAVIECFGEAWWQVNAENS